MTMRSAIENEGYVHDTREMMEQENSFTIAHTPV